MIEVTAKADTAEIEDYVRTYLREEVQKRLKETVNYAVSTAVAKYIDAEVARVLTEGPLIAELQAIIGAQVADVAIREKAKREKADAKKVKK